MIRDLALILVLAAAACGGTQSAPATTTPAAETGGAGGGHQMTHEGIPAELTKFHDVLAPRWHAEPGPARMTDTCAAVPQFKSEADAIATMTPPTPANADTWTAGTRALVAAVANLEATCKANDTAKFDEAFHQVHESFHALMAAAGAKHEPGEHQHGAEHEHGGEHQHGM